MKLDNSNKLGIYTYLQGYGLRLSTEMTLEFTLVASTKLMQSGITDFDWFPRETINRSPF